MMTEQKALWLISKLYPKRHEDEIAREVTRVCVSQERIRRRHRYWDDSRISSELRLRQYDYDVLATARPGGDVARRVPDHMAGCRMNLPDKLQAAYAQAIRDDWHKALVAISELADWNSDEAPGIARRALSSEDATRPTSECERCHGTGIIGNGSVSECQDCDGQGQPATRPTGEHCDESGYPSIAGIEAIVAERDAAAVIVNMVRSWFADQPPDQPGCECEACKLIRAVAVYDQAPAARPTGDKE